MVAIVPLLSQSLEDKLAEAEASYTTEQQQRKEAINKIQVSPLSSVSYISKPRGKLTIWTNRASPSRF